MLKTLFDIILILVATATTITLASTSSSSNPTFTKTSDNNNVFSTTLQPVSLKHGINKYILYRWNKGSNLARLEQYVEDHNADYVAKCNSIGDACKHRRLICLPLDEKVFNPPMGVFSHNHVQTGDKISIPKCFWTAIQINNAQVPWLFSIKRIDGITSDRVQYINDDDNDDIDNYVISEYQPMKCNIDMIVGGPLDFRSPSNYVFVPYWMMRSLGIKPYDIVDVDLIETIPPGSMAKLRPHTKDFINNISNTQAVLETELKHYSSLVQGSTIAFDYNNKRYWFDVVELRSAPRGEKVNIIKVQDCDIATDFVQSKDIMLENKKKKKILQKKQKQQQQHQED